MHSVCVSTDLFFYFLGLKYHSTVVSGEIKMQLLLLKRLDEFEVTSTKTSW